MFLHIQIKGSFISQDNGLVKLEIEMPSDRDVSLAITEHAKHLVELGVKPRLAHGMADDARDEITRDAISRSFTLLG